MRVWPTLASFGAAAVIANVLLTYANAWPTPGARPTLLLSADVAAVALLVGLLARKGRLSWLTRALLAGAIVVLMVVHYADVTTEGLFGKPIDIYWDLAHLPNATVMLAGSSPLLFAAVVLGSAAVLALLFGLNWWIVDALAKPTVGRGGRFAIIGLSGAMLAGWAAGAPGFARPAAVMIVEQARLLGTNLSTAFAKPSSVLAELGADAGADVYVIFFESYAGQVFVEAELAEGISPAHARLEDTLRRTGWNAVSALVTAPTFGGASWLAHASLLAGETIDYQPAYNAFLAAPPTTLIDKFREAGYRTLALMPGLIDPWPEGGGLGFDAVYARRDIGYRGPGFGFWQIPDQASLAWLAETEIAVAGRRPLFVMFPTVMSHIPFGPVPPYQPDWSRFGDLNPYDPPQATEDAEGANGFDFRTPYLRAVRYNLDVLGGFLENVVPEDAVLLVLGDHPPPAIVVGPDAPWSVPVHVFARRAERLAPFSQAGFVSGLRPDPTPVGETADLTHLLLATDLGRGQPPR